MTKTQSQPKNQTHQQLKHNISAQDSLRLRLELGLCSGGSISESGRLSDLTALP